MTTPTHLNEVTIELYLLLVDLDPKIEPKRLPSLIFVSLLNHCQDTDALDNFFKSLANASAMEVIKNKK